MNEISKKVLLLNIIISQVIIIGIGLILIYTIYQEFTFSSLLRFEIDKITIAVIIMGSGLLILLQLLFHKFVSKEKLYDEVNKILIEKFSLKQLFFIFLCGSIVEEFLFRGILQPELGIWVTSILFTLTHYRYYKKFYILIEVFLMGIILGLTYAVTSLLWVPIICHFVVNYFTVVLIKKGYLQIEM